MSQQVSPIILTAHIDVQPGGASGVADSTRLENPFQGPMWLDEIRFRVPNPTAISAAAGVGWSSLRVELKLGDIPLTNGYVPISLLGKVLQESSDNTDETPNTNNALLDESTLQSFTWKLPKPLYIPAREYLKPQMYFDPYSGAAKTTVTITYACRPIPRGTPAPKMVKLPWVAYYQPPYLTVPTVSTTDTFNTSQPSDLYNPFKQDLHVERFLGRFMVQGGVDFFNTTPVGQDGYNVSDLNSAKIDLVTGLPSWGTFVSGQDSFNNILIRDPTPFAAVFDFLDRAWTVHAILPPQGYYMFKIDRMWSGYTPPTPPTTFNATVAISMVGWREAPFLP